MQLKILSLRERKEDARKKIMHGMLLDAKSRMHDDPTLTNKWRTLGQELIKKDTCN